MDPGFVILIVAALVTSVISAVIGLAGGLALLGVMSATLPAPTVVPLHGVVQLFSNITRVLVFLRHVKWSIFLVFAGPMVIGVVIAVLVWSGAVIGYLKPILGIFIILVLVQHRAVPLLHRPPLWIYAVLGVVIGFLAIFVGAVGPVLAPFFLRDDFDNEQTIATKALCQAWAHVLKLPAFLAIGFDYLAHLELLLTLAVAVVVGTLLGKLILRRLSTRMFRIVYKSALAGLALYLIIAGLGSLIG